MVSAKKTLLLTAATIATALTIGILGCGSDKGTTPTPNIPDDTTKTQDTTFDAPKNVVAVATSQNSITVSWSAVFGATGYYIFNSRNATGNYSELDSTTSTSYTHNGLSPNTAYYYKIYAYNGTDISNESRYASATTLPNESVVKGSFKDNRDGKVYKTVEMPDGKTWLGENLNYIPENGNSWCYDDNPANCAIYGRLYDWATAMNISSIYNSREWGGSDEGHQGVCPTGWHLPSRGEWETLVTAAGGDKAGTKLKATTGWVPPDMNTPLGTDDFGFSALPSGEGYPLGYGNLSYGSSWWTATVTDYGDSFAINAQIGSGSEYVRMGDSAERNYRFSVRCVSEIGD